MARDIRLQVTFGDNEQLKELNKAKRKIEDASWIIKSTIGSAFEKYGMPMQEIKAGDGMAGLYLSVSVDFEREKELAKEICEMCDVLYKKIEEYDALMKFEISKAPEKSDAFE